LRAEGRRFSVRERLACRTGDGNAWGVGMRGRVVVAGLAAVCVASWGLGAGPAVAKGSKPKVLLKDALTKPSKAVKPVTYPPPGDSWAFVDKAFFGQSGQAAGGSSFYNPSFTNQGTIGLGDVTVSADVALRQQGVGGVLCRVAAAGGGNHFYYVAIFNDGNYVVAKGVDNGPEVRLASGSVRLKRSNHLVLTCGGPDQPGPSEAVTLSGTVNGQSFSTKDASAAYPGGFVALYARGSSGGGASFRNLKITQP
jgi:hypothetical protein